MIWQIGRFCLAALIAAALYAQMRQVIHAGNSIANFFSFFTVQSNIIAIVALLLPNPVIRGGATVYITITGVVYNLLLRGVEAALQMTIGWVNLVLHDISPLALIVWLIVAPPKLPAAYAKLIPLWMSYPLAYLAYTLVRGHFTTWYPYGFLDPIRQGWGIVGAFCACTTVAVVGLSWLVIFRATTAKPTMISH